MKKIYLFSLFFVVFSEIQAQNTPCMSADSFLIYAYSNVKDAYEANNIQHLKYYSDKSLKSFEKAKASLKKCGCDSAFDLAYNAKELMAKVKATKTFEDGRFYVKRAKEITQNCITELNKCTIPSFKEVEEIVIVEEKSDKDDLKILLQEQEKLEQQQLALKIKEQELLKKLDAQKNKENLVQKETLIKELKAVLSLNIDTCNKVLKIYNCTSELTNYDNNDTKLVYESIDGIKTYYLNLTKKINAVYLEKLNQCYVN